MGRIVKRAQGGAAVPPACVPAAAAVAEETVALLAAARAEANREREAAKATAVVLARKMAEKIVGRAVELDAGVLGEIAAQALAAARPGKAVALLRMHPEDLAALSATRSGWLAEIAGKADVRVAADPAVGRHGCVVETAVGRLDARLETQLDALAGALRAVGIGRP
jgi:flagellar assembly protein FliH